MHFGRLGRRTCCAQSLPRWTELGPNSAQLDQFWANLGQLRPNLADVGPYFAQLGKTWATYAYHCVRKAGKSPLRPRIGSQSAVTSTPRCGVHSTPPSPMLRNECLCIIPQCHPDKSGRLNAAIPANYVAPLHDLVAITTEPMRYSTSSWCWRPPHFRECVQQFPSSRMAACAAGGTRGVFFPAFVRARRHAPGRHDFVMCCSLFRDTTPNKVGPPRALTISVANILSHVASDRRLRCGVMRDEDEARRGFGAVAQETRRVTPHNSHAVWRLILNAWPTGARLHVAGAEECVFRCSGCPDSGVSRG